MTITRIRTVYVAADDVPACAVFYDTILQLPVRFRDGDRWVQFGSDGASFAVASHGESVRGTKGAVVVFEASEEADHLRLIDGAAVLVDARDMGEHGRTRTYRDPAGNLFQLFWRAGTV